MIEQAAQMHQGTVEINPYVTTLAGKLMRTAADAEMKFDSTGWQLITEVLSYAAAAEQRMTEQQDRICFLEQLSVTDELTGIPNRRGLQNTLRQTLASSARHREPGTLGFVDLDGFKEINDINGHMAGDAVLRHVAKRLKAQVRPSDTVARICGDEFAIILPRCTGEQGNKRLRKLQQDINDSVVHYAGASIPVSCSIGFTEFDGKSDATSLIDSADKSMYADKAVRSSRMCKSA